MKCEFWYWKLIKFDGNDILCKKVSHVTNTWWKQPDNFKILVGVVNPISYSQKQNKKTKKKNLESSLGK